MTEQNKERITNGLRTWTSNHFGVVDWPYESIMEFADRIDAAHERQLEVLYRDMSDAEYVELPKDADGEYIHVGDRLEHTNGIFTANDMTISIDGIWRAWDGENGHTVLLAKCRHHKQPTVEDVLDEFVERWHDTHHDDIPALKAEYASKLQLKED